MATWISHLRIAEQLLTVLPYLDESAFTIGNLSPDSGKPNSDWSEFDPPKEVTHFLNKGEGEIKIRDLEFYRRYLKEMALGDTRYSFLLGYFFHLLSDRLWAHLINQTYKIAYATQFAEQGSQFWWTLKEDWNALDFLYLRDHPDSSFKRVLLHTPNPPQYLPFIDEAALNQQLDYIRQVYCQVYNGHLNRPYPYLNAATMTRYVDDTTTRLLKIYHLLQVSFPPDNEDTALCFLDKSELTPYSAPLGDKATA